VQYDASGALIWADGGGSHAYAVVAGTQAWNWTTSAWEAMPAAVTSDHLRTMATSSFSPAAWCSDTVPDILPHPRPITALIFGVDAGGAIVAFAGSALLQSESTGGSLTITAAR
jgi:hypothetical protein